MTRPLPPRTQYVGSILKDVFLIFPQYCLGRGLMDMATEMNINLIVAKFGFISERNRYSWNFLGKYMACMVIQVRETSVSTNYCLGFWRYEKEGLLSITNYYICPLPIIIFVGGLFC